MLYNTKTVCANCHKQFEEHSMDSQRCPPPNLLGTRWSISLGDGEPAYTGINSMPHYSECNICYALVRAENQEKHTAFHEGAKAWFEHLLKESKG